MSVEIFYFSGTGNSLHVARELKQRLPNAKLIPMVRYLDDKDIKTSAEKVGFVFPLYFMTVPAPVRRFIERLDVCSAKYTFSVVTRIGTVNVAHRSIERILNKKGRRLNALFSINMANNSPTGLKPTKGDRNWVKKTSGDKVSQLETGVQAQLDIMEKVIGTRTNYPIKRWPNPFIYILERVMYLATRSINTQIDFYSDETCNGCGVCQAVCPSEKVRIEGKRPKWEEFVKCYYCYACFNFCPTQSILVRNKYTLKEGRYYHPSITAQDITRQKKQAKGEKVEEALSVF
jgi:formate hydrogenlyase subunit 6/NADH:ubiquinone oxidoreductase subunit I/flavodoxin